MDWNDGMSVAENSTSQGYDDWYLPSLEELELMYNTIGQGGPEGNIGGFSNTGRYWSSSVYDPNGSAWRLRFSDGLASSGNMSIGFWVRVIRSF